LSLFELLALGLALAALIDKPANRMKLLAIASLLSLGCARAAGGHAALADPIWLMRPAVFLHAAAAAVWVGALPPLLWLAMAQNPGLPMALRGFSSVAFFTVQALLLLGLVIAAVQMRDPWAFVTSDYGRLLALKLSLVSLLLLLALWNRRVATPQVLAGDQRGARRLAGSIGIEIAMLLCILAVVAGWRFTPPPRALMQARQEIQQEVWSGHTRAVLRLAPGRVGDNQLSMELFDHDGGAVQAKEVTVSLSAPWLGVEPRSVSAIREGSGVWRIPAIFLPAAGVWTVTVEALVSDFERVTAAADCKIAP
jgi:copper transport protein